MQAVLELNELVLATGSGSTSFKLMPGEVLGIFGPSGSGKSLFLETILGRAPKSGNLKVAGTSMEAKPAGGRRLRPQAIAQRGNSLDRAASASEALTALDLWSHRQTSLDKLTDRQRTACELLEPLASRANLILIDGQLDVLSPWALRSTLSLILKRRQSGTSFVIATNSALAATYADYVGILRDGDFRYLGAREALLKGAQREITVRTQSRGAVQALVDPLKASVSATEDGLSLATESGQEVAAKLLLQGYGTLECITLAPTSLIERILER